MQACNFHDVEIVSGVKHKRKIALLIKEILKKKEEYNINYIFCSDQYLLSINKQYLNHDTLTDIITFDLSEEDSEIMLSDIYISIERVKENAKQFEVKFEQELLRVIVHGALHLIGYKDKTATQKNNHEKNGNTLDKSLHQTHFTLINSKNCSLGNIFKSLIDICL